MTLLILTRALFWSLAGTARIPCFDLCWITTTAWPAWSFALTESISVGRGERKEVDLMIKKTILKRKKRNSIHIQIKIKKMVNENHICFDFEPFKWISHSFFNWGNLAIITRWVVTNETKFWFRTSTCIYGFTMGKRRENKIDVNEFGFLLPG